MACRNPVLLHGNLISLPYIKKEGDSPVESKVVWYANNTGLNKVSRFFPYFSTSLHNMFFKVDKAIGAHLQLVTFILPLILLYPVITLIKILEPGYYLARHSMPPNQLTQTLCYSSIWYSKYIPQAILLNSPALPEHIYSLGCSHSFS